MTERPLTFHLRIEAPVETVFAFFTDSANLSRWLGTRVEAEAIPGGRLQVANERDVALGQFLEIVPNRRIVFSWGWKAGPYATRLPPGASTVEVLFEPDGEATRLTLVHRHLSDNMREVHGQGWRHCLGRLRIAAAGMDPGTDPWAAGCQAEE